MNFPLISIVITTSNSEKTLPFALESIRRQKYPKKKLEILVVDAYSKDRTKQIARMHGCKIINNPKIYDTPGKHLAFLKARGKYLMYLDSDEELENPNSIKIKMSAFTANEQIKAVITSGYKNPPGYPQINKYINQLGDPFSFFIYRETMNYNFFLDQFREKYKVVLETQNFAVFDFSKIKLLPLVELVVMGDIINLEFIKKEFPQIKQNTSLVTHLFYLLNQHGALFAITKNDPVIHYSSSSVRRYLKKISWRIKSNIYYNDTLGEAGFSGRSVFQPVWFRFKKFLFIPYSFSFILPLIDSFILIKQTNYWIFLLHPFLCIYTSCLIISYYTLNLFSIKHLQSRYGS